MIEDLIWIGQIYVGPESNDLELESQRNEVGEKIASRLKLNYILLPKSQHQQRIVRLGSNANLDTENVTKFACEATTE